MLTKHVNYAIFKSNISHADPSVPNVVLDEPVPYVFGADFHVFSARYE